LSVFNARGLRPFLVAKLLFLSFLTSAQTVDSLAPKVTAKVPIASGDLSDPVNYKAADSIVYDAKTKKLYLYKSGQIVYQDVQVDASFIIYDQDSSTLTATKFNDSRDSSVEQYLTKAEDKTKFSELKYNFKSERAILSSAYSQYGEGFIKSERIKRNKDQSIYGFKNIYTTCNLETPHFGIAAKKVKIIPNKVAVSGSANLVIEEIPTPLYLPFGMFPLKKGQRSGFKLPTYDASQNLGFGIREGGYYFAISDHVDLLALADIYARGTWRVGLQSTYVWRYRFRGSLGFNYAYNKVGNEFESNFNSSRNFFVNWSHTLDPNVRPGTGFSANVNVGSSKYHTNNSYDANFYLNNNYSSSIAYSKTWEGKPFNLTVNARHNQNTQTGLVTVRLPEVNFSANQIYPFKFRENVIRPKWYEKITASYQMQAINEIAFTDSLFELSNLRFNDFQNGIKHSVPVNATYNLFKYINANFTVNYNEYWYSQKSFKSFNFAQDELDTLNFRGAFTARDFTTAVNLSTRIYGLKLWNKGRLRGFRHMLTPSISLNYRPDFGSGIFNYYYNSFVDGNYNNRRLSRFDGSVIGTPPDGRVGGLGFSLGNNVQIKVKGKNDSVARNVHIIDGLTLNTFYNIAADSFNWSNLNMAYRTTLFKKINISGGASWNPYAIDSLTGNQRNAFNYSVNKKFVRFERANLAVGATFPLRNNANRQAENNRNTLYEMGSNYDNYVDFNIPYTLRINYNLNLTKRFLVASQKDTFQLRQDINFGGDVNLTPKWKIGLQSGYDLQSKQMNFTSIDIYRDLHCWEMKLNLIPFGFRRSYNFALNVKAQVLQDLKLIRRKDFRDNF